jgi:integrase
VALPNSACRSSSESGHVGSYAVASYWQRKLSICNNLIIFEQQSLLSAIAATKLIAVGWRSGEALALKWSDLDLTRRIAILPDTKTGRSVRVLSRAACDLLCDQPKMGPLVFPAARDNASRMAGGYRKAWNRLMKGKLSPTITPHVLRHSFASLAHDLGYSELLIAALLGHAATTVTSRYTHAADAVLLAAADAVANRTAELMNCLKVGAEVILLRRELTS